MKRIRFARLVVAAFVVVALAGAVSLAIHSPTVRTASAGVACAPAPLPGCNGIDGTKSSALLDIKASHDGSGFVAGKGKLTLKIKGLVGASLEALGAPGGSATTDATMTDD